MFMSCLCMCIWILTYTYTYLYEYVSCMCMCIWLCVRICYVHVHICTNTQLDQNKILREVYSIYVYTCTHGFVGNLKSQWINYKHWLQHELLSHLEMKEHFALADPFRPQKLDFRLFKPRVILYCFACFLSCVFVLVVWN